ncbi:MAG: hypothetical protein CK424_08605 [Legionella sp.]|nr:MAG: hypothetical protein CK424_08605 [Legionella sp.]
MNNWFWGLAVLLLTIGAIALVFWPLRRQRHAWLLGPILLVCVGMMYWHWGSWSGVWAYEQQQKQQQKAQALLRTIKSPDALIQRLQAHLAVHPRAAKGWYLLGRLYASQHRWQDSLDAFSKAYEIKPTDESISINYAQGLFARQNPQQDAEARKILITVLKRHPQQMDALAMLAIDAQTHHDRQGALDYWQRLLPLVPQHSEEANVIRKSIVRLKAQP